MEPLKELFNIPAAKALANQIATVFSNFDGDLFVKIAVDDLQSREMLDRARQFSAALEQCLPEDRDQAIQILVESLPDPMPATTGFAESWKQWPLGHFIENHGLEFYELSMSALYQLTQRFTAEFAVRAFAERYPERTYAKMLEWTLDPSAHVRRWCSEGLRPRLPWGRRLKRLIDSPRPLWPILDRLHRDESDYVRRSVANCLNDVGKDHPQEVVAKCQEWLAAGKTADLEKLVAHGLRTMVKNGDPDALALLGYKPLKDVDLSFQITNQLVMIGEVLHMELRMNSKSPKDQPVILDFEVSYLLSNGSYGAKVFKWKKFILGGGKNITLSKNFTLRHTSVRSLHLGRHSVRPIVNGRLGKTQIFEIVAN